MSQVDLLGARGERLHRHRKQRLAVLLPCCNEEVAIGRMICEFRSGLIVATVRQRKERLPRTAPPAR